METGPSSPAKATLVPPLQEPWPSRMSVLLGNGDGTFRDALIFPAGDGPNSVAVGDFNGDGNLDIVTTNFSYTFDGHRGIVTVKESDVRVFLGNGDGTFQPAGIYNTGRGPTAVAVADFNGDGIPDLAVADGVATSELADGLLQWPGTRALIRERLGPTALVVAEEEVELLRQRLEELGVKLTT